MMIWKWPIAIGCAMSLFAGVIAAAAQVSDQPMHFVFAPAAGASGHGIVVQSSDSYNDQRGWGYEAGSSHGGASLFSVKVPEGNCAVTVVLGDPGGESDTTVKAEQRRLMLESVKTAKGETVRRTFVVNVRTPKIAGENRDVKL